ncbi:hypothetical protein Taro_009614 [Colocasia esculenta]|uniref:Uncharacterized protein n=1 Tax=Colocasia esculenta TaxID=4460 RepID=A0A843U702_COLES|nr:hypothetical protein [Colocasia esculenta]
MERILTLPSAIYTAMAALPQQSHPLQTLARALSRTPRARSGTARTLTTPRGLSNPPPAAIPSARTRTSPLSGRGRG